MSKSSSLALLKGQVYSIGTPKSLWGCATALILGNNRDAMSDRTQTPKPNDTEIRALADNRIKELLKTHGPGLNEEFVLATFQDWVLPDRQLTIIRERLELWKQVASKRVSRRAKGV
jgi:hypothetical protein